MRDSPITLIGPHFGFVVVGILWGITNPLIKRGSVGVDKLQIPPDGFKLYHEIKFLISKRQFMLPFLLNQSGSLLYYLLLESSDLTVAVTITNSVPFLVTALCGWVLGEEPLKKRTLLGMLLVVCGLIVCLGAKSKEDGLIGLQKGKN